MEAEEIEEIEINRGVSGTAALRRKKDAIELVASDQLLRTLPGRMFVPLPFMQCSQPCGFQLLFTQALPCINSTLFQTIR